jgi:hypothetical protein
MAVPMPCFSKSFYFHRDTIGNLLHDGLWNSSFKILFGHKNSIPSLLKTYLVVLKTYLIKIKL